MKLIGLISDTHGLLRPQAVAALSGVELIVHAGDMGSPDVIAALQQIAPVFAVRGNVDGGPWADRFPPTQVVEVAGKHLYVLHDLNQLDLDPVAADVQVVVSGHTHQPSVTVRRGVLYVNPGSCGPRRFRLPVTVAHLRLGAGEPSAEIIELPLTAPGS